MARKKSRRPTSRVTRKRSPELEAKLRKRPAPGATAPDSAIPTASIDTSEQADEQELELSRGSALPSMLKSHRRKQWGLPEEANSPGPYMVELNLRHPEGLDGAGAAFRDELFPAVMGKEGGQPEPITSAYFRGRFTVPQWLELTRLDEQWYIEKKRSKSRGGKNWERCIYRIWPDFQVKALTDRSVATVKADAAVKSFSASGKHIVWAVIDSGVDASHRHFGNLGNGHRLLYGDCAELHWDFTSDAPKDRKKNLASALSDPCGHGTHVAGIITGQAPADAKSYERVFTPISQTQHTMKWEQRWCDAEELHGVAPECQIVSLRVLNENGQGLSGDVIRALAYIRETVNKNPKMLRIHGVNLSVGYEFDAEMFACGQSPLCAEVDRLVQSGVVVVAAAGNTGYGTAQSDVRLTRLGMSNSINDPGNAMHAITVGATHREFPHTYGVSYFSSKGPTGDGRLKPDLVAPGERITSCAAGNKLTGLQIKPSARKRGAKNAIAAYLDESGTSMAAPHVSGAIAAFLSIRREFIGKPKDVKDIFLKSATPLGRERYFEGHGLVDLMRAIQSV
jgi:serine protease AprX